VSVRVLLAVLVAAALVAAAMPAVEDAQQGVAATATERETGRLSDAIRTIRRTSDPVPRGVPGARRLVTVDLPAGSGDAPTLRVGGGDADPTLDGNHSDVLTYDVPPGTGGRETVDVDLRVVRDGAVGADDEGLVLRGRQTVVLRYVLVDDEPTVTVARLYA